MPTLGFPPWNFENLFPPLSFHSVFVIFLLIVFRSLLFYWVGALLSRCTFLVLVLVSLSLNSWSQRSFFYCCTEPELLNTVLFFFLFLVYWAGTPEHSKVNQCAGNPDRLDFSFFLLLLALSRNSWSQHSFVAPGGSFAEPELLDTAMLTPVHSYDRPMRQGYRRCLLLLVILLIPEWALYYASRRRGLVVG